ncbi:histidine kinase [Streptomyces sp. HNM0574]|uniref:sensor histidine kinase n=1 Tax=Streptomyces sp. HNM0574 TaxID=2714954 RepID=UPI00146BB686|nr:histidine kinase [Streptomyces sp. HNM0574]NLU69969.1 sensor histidine kinase [Streptomyces sp. HNM0574]
MTETGDGRAVGAAAEGGGPLWWERRRGAALDVSLAVASAGECGWQGVGFAEEAGLPVWAGVVLGVVVGSVLVLRRRWPVAVVLVAIAVTPTEMGFLLGVVGLYSLAASDVPRRIIALLSGMQAVGTLVITFVRMHQSMGRDPDFDPPSWLIPLVSVVMSLGLSAPPVLLGLYVGARRRLVESLRERAQGLEGELALLAERAEERAEWARSEERHRIAREMHDVVAHRVSLMVVHAAALQAVALKDPEKASKNAQLVGDMGRQALSELRTMLGVLRADEMDGAEAEGAGASGGGRASGASEVPARLAEFAASSSGRGAGASGGAEGQSGGPAGGADVPGEVAGEGDGEVAGPSLEELDVLVGQSRTAGMVVDFSVEGEPRCYAAAVEQTAFRVVQEALTNVHKHAAGARARVRLAHRAGEVAVQVENEPPGEGAGAGDAGLPSGGNGLVGMRERVTSLGGGFVSGATDAGGFRVSAVIPDRG